MKNFYLTTSSILLCFCCTMISTSCQDVEPLNDQLIYNQEAINKFNQAIQANSNDLKMYTDFAFHNKYQANLDRSEVNSKDTIDEEKAKKLLEFLVKPSKDFLLSSGFTENELLDEFNSMDGPEVLFTAIGTLIILETKQRQTGSVKNQTYENSIMECLGAASGIKGLWDLATGAAAASRSTIIKTFGKFARRSMGWIGAALFMAEFVQCYWGDNNSFE